MAREHRNTRLQTREARSKLKPREEPYWHDLERGRSIGYFRGVRGGSWRLREFIGGAYRKRHLGRADDINDADGVTILSFMDAVRRALQEDRPTLQIQTRWRVEDALDEYFEARQVSSTSDSIHRDRVAADAYIVPADQRPASQLSERQRKRLRNSLRGKLIDELTTVELRRWRDSLVPNTKDPDERRRAKSSANRVWAVLRAALNLAFQNQRVNDDRAWRRLTPFKNVDQPQTRFLRIEECRRLIAAADGELRPLVGLFIYRLEAR